MIDIVFFRIADAIIRYLRKLKVRSTIACQHNNFHVVGPITIINRNISLGNNVTIYPGVMFWGDGPIIIGDNVSIGNHTIIYSSRQGGIIIGNDTQIAAQCYIIDMDHGMNRNETISCQKNTVAKIIIGDDCWLGANVTVLKGSVIGQGAVVGAKSLVRGKIEAYTINVGIPSRKIKDRI